MATWKTDDVPDITGIKRWIVEAEATALLLQSLLPEVTRLLETQES
jgi:hypothetical protein